MPIAFSCCWMICANVCHFCTPPSISSSVAKPFGYFDFASVGLGRGDAVGEQPASSAE